MDTEHLDLLREALPYIQRFKGKTFVVKLSGQVTEDPITLLSLAEEMALCHQVGFRMVVVHGGGKQLTELAEKLGIRQTIVNGRRITDSETLEIAKMVFAGKINTDILSVLRRLGVATVGLSGLDGNIVRARRREIQRVINRETGQEELIDYGHVGDIVEIDAQLLRLLLDQGYVPVISSLGADDQGNVYNINADTIAAEIAVHLQAEKLITLTNVDGIYLDVKNPDTKISRLTLTEAEQLVQSSHIAAGMFPKLMAIISLLKRGVKSAHIINGARRNALLQEIFTDEGTGTMITS
jgi:acetylglutamate kinase